MKNLIDLSTSLVQKTNSHLSQIFAEYKSDPLKYNEILIKINNLKKFITEEKSIARIDMIICKLNSTIINKNRIIKITRDGKLLGVVCDNIIKPVINIEKCDEIFDCNHNLKMNQNNFNGIYDENNFLLIEDYDNLNNILSEIQGPVMIKIYKHDYRTFKPFTCFILIVTQQNYFLIDTLKLRKIKNDFFKCKNYKLFHCLNCKIQFENEFCNLGCFEVMEGRTNIFCDWRIRPLNTILKEIIKNDVSLLIEDFQYFLKQKEEKKREELISKKCIFKYNSKIFKNELGLDSENYNKLNDYHTEDASFSNVGDIFVKKYTISEDNKKLVDEILKLRCFIAKSNNESLFYVLTDNQVLNLIYKKPLNRDDFIECLGRMSALAREHCCDFTMIIQQFEKEEENSFVKETNLDEIKNNDFNINNVQNLNDQENKISVESDEIEKRRSFLIWSVDKDDENENFKKNSCDSLNFINNEKDGKIEKKYNDNNKFNNKSNEKMQFKKTKSIKKSDKDKKKKFNLFDGSENIDDVLIFKKKFVKDVNTNETDEMNNDKSERKKEKKKYNSKKHK
ncbi:Exosome component 10 [Gurleya vavrai]